eukprot:scpid36823/ scgid6117/ Rho guanine nucleotide exchange factor 16; Ephexin-4
MSTTPQGNTGDQSMLTQRSQMSHVSAMAAGPSSPAPTRGNVGRLVQQLNTHVVPKKPAAAAAGLPTAPSTQPQPNACPPLTKGRSSPPTSSSVASEANRHAVCASPASSAKSSTPSPGSESPAAQKRPTLTDSQQCPPVNRTARPKPPPMPKPRDKPRVNANNQVVVSMKRSKPRRTGLRPSPKNSPQNTLEAASGVTSPVHRRPAGAGGPPKKPLPVPKPRPPMSTTSQPSIAIATSFDGAHRNYSVSNEGAGVGQPPLRPEEVMAAAAHILSTDMAIKKRPVRKRSVRRAPRVTMQTKPRTTASDNGAKHQHQHHAAPIVYELAGASIGQQLAANGSESSASSATPSDDLCSGGLRNTSSSESLVTATASGAAGAAAVQENTSCVYEAVEGASLPRAPYPLKKERAIDEDAWEDVETPPPQLVPTNTITGNSTPGNMVRFRNMAGRLLKGQEVPGSVSNRSKKPGAAIAAASAFLRQYLPGKSVSDAMTSPAGDCDGGDADVYSDVSADEWEEDEDDSVYSAVGEEAYSSAPAPALTLMAAKPLPPIPSEDYSYATRGESAQSPPAIGKERKQMRPNDPLFYCVSENTVLETEVVMANLSVDNDPQGTYSMVGEDAQRTATAPVKKIADGPLVKPRLVPVRSQSPAKEPKPSPKPKRKLPHGPPAAPLQGPCRLPKPVTASKPSQVAGKTADIDKQDVSDIAEMEVVKPRIDHSYSEVNLRNKSVGSKLQPTRPQSMDSWGNTPPPPLMERIKTSSLDKDAMFSPHDSSPDQNNVCESGTLTNDGEWGDTDTFTPGHPPPRHASISASEKSIDQEFTTLLQRHRARQGAQPAVDECSEDEDELTSNSALSTICSDTSSDRDNNSSRRADTLDRVVISLKGDQQPGGFKVQSLLSSPVPGGQARQQYMNITHPSSAGSGGGAGAAAAPLPHDQPAHFYQNTVQATTEDDPNDLFEYGELPFRGDDGSVAIRPGGLQSSKGVLEESPLKSVPNKHKKLKDCLSSSFGLEEPALYQYVSDLNFKGNPLEPLHFGDAGSNPGPMGVDEREEDEDDFEDDDNAIYQGLDSTTYECVRGLAPLALDKKLRESVRETKKRMLWCEQVKVRNSGILMNISDDERHLQEANFEVITSEISYNRSLKILIDHFMDSPLLSPDLPADRRILSRDSYKHLFSNIKTIYEISSRLLEALKDCESQMICIENVCNTIYDFVRQAEFFEPYVTYCKNQIYQLREMKRLQERNPRFNEVVAQLENDKKCQGLPLLSFFTLPTQRITRFPLLIVAIIDRMQPEDKNYETSQQSLELTQALVRRCNEAARSMERTEQLIDLHTKIDFGKVKQLGLVSSSRWLVRSGELSLLSVEKAVIRKGARVQRQSFHLFLFNDLIILAKKKTGALGLTSSDSSPGYTVLDYAWRSAVELEDLPDAPGAAAAQTPQSGSSAHGVHYAAVHPALSPQLSKQDSYDVTTVVSAAGAQNAMKLVLLENAHQKNAVFLLVAQSQSEKYRWLNAVNPPQPTTDGETIYGEWDCPQVKVTYPYASRQPDELNLSAGEVIKVLRKMADGWYEGERMRDGFVGWFPSTHCKEIQNEHTRFRNMRHQYHMQKAEKGDKLTPIKPEKPVNKPTRSPGKFRNSILVRLNSAGAEKQ